MDKKLTICYIVNDLVVGGVSSVLINLCNNLNSSIYDINLIVLSDNTPMESIIPLNKSIKKHIVLYDFDLNYSLLGYLKSAFTLKNTKLRANKVLDKIVDINPDILHFHTLPRQLLIGQLAQQNNPEIKLVFTDHLVRISINEYKNYQAIFLTIAYRRMYQGFNVIAVSKAVYSHLQNRSIPDKNKFFKLLENSINIELYNRTKKISHIKENCTIYVSRINHHKGQETLIKAWKKIKRTDKGKLLIIGPDESNGKFKILAKEDSSILFPGSVSKIKDYLNNATLAIFPSQKEGLPISLLEKMAFRLPVIVSDIPELTLIISDKKEGLHFKLDNVEDLVNKIEFAFDNQSKMIELGKNARKKVEDICKRNESITFHNSLYKEILI